MRLKPTAIGGMSGKRKPTVKLYRSKTIRALLLTTIIVGGLSLAYAQQEQRGATSYMPVDIKDSFASIMARMKAAKPDIEKEHTNLLSARYDLSNRPAKDATMSRGKPLQEGVRVKLPAGATWRGGRDIRV